MLELLSTTDALPPSHEESARAQHHTFLESRPTRLNLRALLCFVFNSEQGPVILCSDPPKACRERVNLIGGYMLPEKTVQGRVISLVLDDYTVMGVPVYIEDQVYDRNNFQFNICMVIRTAEEAPSHQLLAQHLAMAFLPLEKELGLLSNKVHPDQQSPDLAGEERATKVRTILEALRDQLNKQEACFVRVTHSHCICFRIRDRPLVLPPSPDIHQVVVPLFDPDAVRSRDDGAPFELDLACKHLLNFIDGRRSVERLVVLSQLRQETVILLVRHLVFFQLVAIVNPIERSSKYVLTPEFHVAFSRPHVQQNVVSFVTYCRRQVVEPDMVEEVQALYSELGAVGEACGAFESPLETLEGFAHRKAIELERLDICLERFIAFGLMEGFVEQDSEESLLTSEELTELRTLRKELNDEKANMAKTGMSAECANKQDAVQERVTRMHKLLEKG